MSCPFMTVDPSVFHDLIARAVKLVIQIHHSLRQSCGHGNDLKGRSWFIGIVDRRISPHLITGVLKFLICHLGSIGFCIQGKRIIPAH